MTSEFGTRLLADMLDGRFHPSIVLTGFDGINVDGSSTHVQIASLPIEIRRGSLIDGIVGEIHLKRTGRFHDRAYQFFNLLGREFVHHDLSHYLNADFAGEYLDQYTLRQPKPKQ